MTTNLTSRQLRVSVIICAYTDQRWQDLTEAVQSVRDQSDVPDEVIVVIDHNEGLLERCVSGLQGVKVVSNRQAKGLSGARNTGIHSSTGDIVAFLDDDALAEFDWIKRLRGAYTNPVVVGVGGHVEPVWIMNRPSWFPDEFLWVVGCSYTGLPAKANPVRNLIGANMSLRRTVLDEVGDFNVEVGQTGNSMLRCDDTELCIRIGQRIEAGVLLYEPAVRVRHRVPASRTSWSYFVQRCFTEGIAKAQIASLFGQLKGLASERTYVTEVLPSSFLRHIVKAVVERDSHQLLMAMALGLGVGATGLGFIWGNIVQIRNPRRLRPQLFA